MADVVVIDGDDETPEPIIDAVEDESTDDVVEAVADAMVTGAVIADSARPDPTQERSSADQRIDGLITQVAELSATVASLTTQLSAVKDTAEDADSTANAALIESAEDSEDESDEDTIQPERRHPWFRRMSEWRG